MLARSLIQFLMLKWETKFYLFVHAVHHSAIMAFFSISFAKSVGQNQLWTTKYLSFILLVFSFFLLFLFHLRAFCSLIISWRHCAPLDIVSVAIIFFEALYNSERGSSPFDMHIMCFGYLVLTVNTYTNTLTHGSSEKIFRIHFHLHVQRPMCWGYPAVVKLLI